MSHDHTFHNSRHHHNQQQQEEDETPFQPMFDNGGGSAVQRKIGHSLGAAETNRQNLESIRARGAASAAATQQQPSSATMLSPAASVPPATNSSSPVVPVAQMTPSEARVVAQDNDDVERKMFRMGGPHTSATSSGGGLGEQPQQPDVFEREYEQIVQQQRHAAAAAKVTVAPADEDEFDF